MDKKTDKVDKYCQKHQCRKERWCNVAMPEGRWVCLPCERERYAKKATERQFFQYATSSKKIGEKMK